MVRDSTSWRTRWDLIVANRGNKPLLPAVDFNSDMVVIVGSQTHPWNGFRVSIDSVILGNRRLTVYGDGSWPGLVCCRCGIHSIGRDRSDASAQRECPVRDTHPAIRLLSEWFLRGGVRPEPNL